LVTTAGIREFQGERKIDEADDEFIVHATAI
jgi:hypothetical protein